MPSPAISRHRHSVFGLSVRTWSVRACVIIGLQVISTILVQTRAVEVGFKNLGFYFLQKKPLKTSKVQILGFSVFKNL